MPVQSNAEGIFQSASASIAGNNSLREAQRYGYEAVWKHFQEKTSHAIVQIPVGCGKTGLMAVLPFGLSQGRVLIIAPNLEIRDGVFKNLSASSSENFLKKAGVLQRLDNGPFACKLEGQNANLHDCNDSQFIVTNIQQLASSSDRWLSQFSDDYFDMILVTSVAEKDEHLLFSS